MQEEALKTSKGTYLGCLFFMMANKRYEPVKAFLHKGFLTEKQQYPHNVLAMKRFMVNFIDAAAGKPHSQQKESSGESSTKMLPSLTLIVCRVPGIEKKLTILSESKGI